VTGWGGESLRRGGKSSRNRAQSRGPERRGNLIIRRMRIEMGREGVDGGAKTPQDE